MDCIADMRYVQGLSPLSAKEGILVRPPWRMGFDATIMRVIDVTTMPRKFTSQSSNPAPANRRRKVPKKEVGETDTVKEQGGTSTVAPVGTGTENSIHVESTTGLSTLSSQVQSNLLSFQELGVRLDEVQSDLAGTASST